MSLLFWINLTSCAFTEGWLLGEISRFAWRILILTWFWFTLGACWIWSFHLQISSPLLLFQVGSDCLILDFCFQERLFVKYCLGFWEKINCIILVYWKEISWGYIHVCNICFHLCIVGNGNGYCIIFVLFSHVMLVAFLMSCWGFVCPYYPRTWPLKCSISFWIDLIRSCFVCDLPMQVFVGWSQFSWMLKPYSTFMMDFLCLLGRSQTLIEPLPESRHTRQLQFF